MELWRLHSAPISAYSNLISIIQETKSLLVYSLIILLFYKDIKNQITSKLNSSNHLCLEQKYNNIKNKINYKRKNKNFVKSTRHSAPEIIEVLGRNIQRLVKIEIGSKKYSVDLLTRLMRSLLSVVRVADVAFPSSVSNHHCRYWGWLLIFSWSTTSALGSCHWCARYFLPNGFFKHVLVSPTNRSYTPPIHGKCLRMKRQCIAK